MSSITNFFRSEHPDFSKPAIPSQPSWLAYRGIGQMLTQNDVGQSFMRSYPLIIVGKYGDEFIDNSALAIAKKTKEAACIEIESHKLTLLSINEENMVFNREFICQIKFPISKWNDGNWIDIKTYKLCLDSLFPEE